MKNSLLDRILYPKWYLEARDVFDGFAADNKRFIDWCDAEIHLMQTAPKLQQGSDPFIPESAMRTERD